MGTMWFLNMSMSLSLSEQILCKVVNARVQGSSPRERGALRGGLRSEPFRPELQCLKVGKKV